VHAFFFFRVSAHSLARALLAVAASAFDFFASGPAAAAAASRLAGSFGIIAFSVSVVAK